jgi:hypothetical protein
MMSHSIKSRVSAVQDEDICLPNFPSLRCKYTWGQHRTFKVPGQVASDAFTMAGGRSEPTMAGTNGSKPNRFTGRFFIVLMKGS